MGVSDVGTPLARLRSVYRLELSQPVTESFDSAPYREAVAAARADASLTAREREEVDLIDAKIDMRTHMRGETELLLSAKAKLEKFLETASTPEFLSEARGWLAHINLKLGDRTVAGKFYLDELNRDGSNLSRGVILESLSQTYGYDGNPGLLEHLDDYFDTAEHAVFAVQLLTNPSRGDRGVYSARYGPRVDPIERAYPRIRSLLDRHKELFQSEFAGNSLALLSLRAALRAGDPPGAIQIAAMIPADAQVRLDPDFQWMLASAYFLSHQFAAAEKPLLQLFESSRSSAGQKASAAYGLCGVYRKTGNFIEEIRFASYLRNFPQTFYNADPSEYMSVSWPFDTFDLALLLDAEAPLPALEGFIAKYGQDNSANLVRYALAVRLARLDRYDQAAQVYESISELERAGRMHQLAGLYRETKRSDLSAEQSQAARFALAAYIGSNENKLYFNDKIWSGWQRGALSAERENGFTRSERTAQIALERKLKDDQEEYWRAYTILRGVVQDAEKTDQGRKAAKLAIQCVRRISERFGRRNELVKADLELSRWLMDQ
jgi:hypothetical protein